MNTSWRYSLSISVATVIAYYVTAGLAYWSFPESGPISSLWACLSAIITLDDSVHETLQAAKARMMGTLIGAAIASMMSLLVNANTPNGLEIFLGIFLCALVCHFANTRPYVRVAGITFILIIVLKPIAANASGYEFTLARIVDSLIGCSAAVLTSLTWRLSSTKPH